MLSLVEPGGSRGGWGWGWGAEDWHYGLGFIMHHPAMKHCSIRQISVLLSAKIEQHGGRILKEKLRQNRTRIKVTYPPPPSFPPGRYQ